MFHRSSGRSLGGRSGRDVSRTGASLRARLLSSRVFHSLFEKRLKAVLYEVSQKLFSAEASAARLDLTIYSVKTRG
jgi:hypothetical protein